MDTKDVPFGHTVFVLLIHRRLELKELRPEAEQEMQKAVENSTQYTWDRPGDATFCTPLRPHPAI